MTTQTQHHTSPPSAWEIRSTPRGTEITFHYRRKEAARLALLIGVVAIALFGYGSLTFLQGWVVNGEEVLVGGIVVFALMLGGVAFGLHCIRQYFRRERYLLGGDSFRIETLLWGKTRSSSLAKAEITGIILLHTPPRRNERQDTWRTLLSLTAQRGKNRSDIALEGWSEEDARWLSAVISTWGGYTISHQENT